MDPSEIDDRPIYDQPPCPGVNTHPWRLWIEEGKMVLTSGCVECEEGVLGPVGGEDVHMYAPIVGRLESHLEVYGYETPEYDHWWEFIPNV